MLIEILTRKIQNDPTLKRHFAKTISWRIVGTFDTVLLGWLVTGNLHFGAKIGALELFTKMVLYFIHERVWYKMRFGVPGRFKKAEEVKRKNAGNLFVQESKVNRQQIEARNNHRSFTIWLTGLSAAGKSTIAGELHSHLFSENFKSYVVDGDNTRLGINSDLSFSKEDRSENIRRVAEICKLFNDAGTIVIASFISPFEADRAMAKSIVGNNDFIEVFVDASIEICKKRDKKGLYRLAEQGKVKDFTGISSPYEIPLKPNIHLHTDKDSISDCVSQIVNFLVSNNYLVRIKQTNAFYSSIETRSMQ